MGPYCCDLRSEEEPAARVGRDIPPMTPASMTFGGVQPRIYRLCLAFSRNRAEAKDLIAQTFLLAWRKIDWFQDGDFLASVRHFSVSL